MAFDTVVDKAQLEGAITASANAIREKTGDSALIEWKPGNGFADEISSIQANPVIQPLTVTENGTYEAPAGVDGYSPVTVAIESGGGGDDGEILDALITREITSINNNTANGVGYASFKNCYDLKKVKFSNATYIYGEAFYDCQRLEIADFPKVTRIITKVFYNNHRLYALILRSESICELSNTNSFKGCTEIDNKTGYIYVPSALVAEYQAATNWSTYATQFRALEDYTVDGTITGELDPDKI